MQEKNLAFSIWLMPFTQTLYPRSLEKTFWMNEWCVLGNKQADLMADAGADTHKVPAVKARDSIRFIDHLGFIQERLIAVVKLFPCRNRGRPTAAQISRNSLACTESSHCCIRQGTSFFVLVEFKHISYPVGS